MSGRRSTPARLSDRQRAFVDEYLIDLNVAAAARRSGYAATTAHAPDKLLTPAVLEAIDQALAQRAERTRVAADKVIAELARIAFANMADFIRVDDQGRPHIDFTALARDNSAALQSLTVDYWRPPAPRKRDRDRAAAGAGGRQPADPADHAPAPSSCEASGEGATPRRIRIQLADKRAALIDLARHLGLRDPAPEADDGTFHGAPVYKFIHTVTGVPHHTDPTGKKGFMMQIAGPPAPQRPEPPMTEPYRLALEDRRAQGLPDVEDPEGTYEF